MRSSLSSSNRVELPIESSGSPSTPRITKRARTTQHAQRLNRLFKIRRMRQADDLRGGASGVQHSGDRMEEVSHAQFLPHFEKPADRRVVQRQVQIREALLFQFDPDQFGSPYRPEYPRVSAPTKFLVDPEDRRLRATSNTDPAAAATIAAGMIA